MKTKFRAFQLDSDGSLFSYFKPNYYTLIEARIPKGGIVELQNDLRLHYKDNINKLHITSWDDDHCRYNDLVQILNHLRPDSIEVPDYDPETENGKLCIKTLTGYDSVHQKYVYNVRRISKEYINGLVNGIAWEANDIIYHSLYNTEKSNDKSLIRLFRSAGFNVLSLGDCENAEIAKSLLEMSFILNEVDVLILPHHGADNGFITGEFLDKVAPKIAISTSNHGNQYGHPNPNIRSLLAARKIDLYTTKHGDIIVKHLIGEDEYGVHDYKSDNEKVEPLIKYKPKRPNSK